MLEILTSHSRVGQAGDYQAPAWSLLPPVDPIHPDLEASDLGEIREFTCGTIVSAREPLPMSPRHQRGRTCPAVIAVVELDDGTWICAWIAGCTFDLCAPATRVIAEPTQAHDGLPVFRLH